MVPPLPRERPWGWLGPLLVTAFAGFLRFFRLGEPNSVVFDETFYIKDAYSLLKFGVERQTLGDSENPLADKMLMAGDLNIFKKICDGGDCSSFVAHPPLGKWMIAAGEWLFGMNPFGWRFAAALVGTLSVLIIARVARRMTRSTLLGCLAGLLLALDGLEFVLSRTALLDIFLMFWVLAGFACLVADRDKSRERLVGWYQTSPVSGLGPWLGVRPWRIAAGLCLGAAVAVKWSGVFFLIAFALMSLLWDVGARRAVGLRHPWRGTYLRDLTTAVGALGAAPVAVYLASWTGWFVTPLGWGRNWAQATSSGPFFFLFDSFRSWIGYQKQVLGYHVGLSLPHPYQSEPWQWPLLNRPVSFHFLGDLPSSACGAEECAQAVLGVGTPALWYAAIAALLAVVVWYVASRDWRPGAVLLGYAAGWLPWFYFAFSDNRTMYLFYMIPVVPFMVLAIVLTAGLILGRENATQVRRAVGATALGALTLIILVDFWWLVPVLSSQTITHAQWGARMLLRTWP